jgi:hypothetical protein
MPKSVERPLFGYESVAIVEGDVRNYHKAVEDIQVNDEITAVQNFVGNARRVTEQDDEQEDNAFTGVFARRV